MYILNSFDMNVSMLYSNDYTDIFWLMITEWQQNLQKYMIWIISTWKEFDFREAQE